MNKKKSDVGEKNISSGLEDSREPHTTEEATHLRSTGKLPLKGNNIPRDGDTPYGFPD